LAIFYEFFLRRTHVNINSYSKEIEEWRAQKDAELRADDGWLALAGLFWLKDGHNYFGTVPANDIVLPTNSASARVGDFELHDGTTMLQVLPGVRVSANGIPITSLVMQPDKTVVVIESLTLMVIKRGGRYAVRLWNKQSPARQSFKGRRWYPADPSYRVTARFIAHVAPRELDIINIYGDPEPMPSPGYVIFNLCGQEIKLDAIERKADLFFIIHDLTGETTTYPAGRFLYSELSRDGEIVLDFNKAHSPPCAFTQFATCPLPPQQNRMMIRIEAGEIYNSNNHNTGL
jgi:uncharacterized protein